MSIKDLFYNQKKYKIITSSSLDNLTDTLESPEYISEFSDEKGKYIPRLNFGKPENFAHYGSAESYYEKAFERIYQQYPYDGSQREKIEYLNSSSYLDRWIFDNVYPRKNGHITIGQNWDHKTLDSFTADSNLYSSDGYVVSPKPQYVFLEGGPNPPAIRPYDDRNISGDLPDFKNPLHKANLFDTNKDLESNLQINGHSGSTVEFWFKAGATPAGTSHNFLGPSPNVALFDLWNSSSLSVGSDNPATYGRFLVEMRREREVSATAVDAIDMAGYQAAGDPSCKFTIAIPVSAGGTGTTVTIKFDISSAGSPSSAGANHITIGTAGSSDTANAALVIKAINGTADSRITYGNSSGDASSGVGIQGITASAGSGGTKVTLTIDLLGESGNISGAIAHGAGTVNLVDVTAFTSGVSELDKFKGDNLFYLTIMSGNSGVDRAPIGAGNLTGSYPLEDWNHFAFTFQNNGNSGADDQMDLKLYINGDLQSTVVTGTAIGEITEGPHMANIGAYMYAPNTASVSGFTAGGRNQEGIGCVSGSFDEFRFWKERRNSKQINTYYNTQVGGGTNTDFVGQHLGIYYKFNEGITGDLGTDQNVLDYSGRISNGFIKNYTISTVSGTAIRSEGSAIVSSSAATRENLDPIIYPYHPDVVNTLGEYKSKGYEYDQTNSNALYNSIPEWIRQGDEKAGNVENLFQILSSYFDLFHVQVNDLPRLKDVRYLSGSNARPLPFAKEAIESAGFFAPELFPNADVLSLFLDKDNNGNVYKKSIKDIKNFIYQNIYNNLTYINKSKGTSKSIRNLLRCFGVDDELFSINFYADNQTFRPEGNYRLTTTRKKYADFNATNRQSAVVFQSTASSNTNSSGYINHSGDASNGFDSDIGMTFESEIIFPIPADQTQDNIVSGSFGHLSSSLFGVHTAKASAADLTWDSNDYGNFQVYAVRDEQTTPNSKNAYFLLTSTSDGIMASNEITSSLFYGVYENQRWNFAVVVKPKKAPNSTYVSGSSDDYVVEFHGYNFTGDLITDSFMVTASVSNTIGKRFTTSNKRFYAGAHRTNFAGDVINQSDVRTSGCRIWTIPLTEAEIKAHARDITNFGVANPSQPAYLNENKSTFSGYVPRIETLAMHWDFATVSGSDDSGEFLVEDLSSGSSDNRYGDFSPILEKQHTGQGMFFESDSSDSISNQFVQSAKTQFFENLNDESFIKILDKDDEYFGTAKARPIRYFFSIEKSMHQAINDEMIDFFAGLVGLQSYASTIGEPVNKYRHSYKKLDFIKRIFFEKVSNVPDNEKYMEFYHWFDDAVSSMILNLIPATSDFAGVQNTIESHILERNKYRHKFPTIDSKTPDLTGSIGGINKLKYNWKFGHAPLSPDGGTGNSSAVTAKNQNLNTLWWKNRAERNTNAPNNFNAVAFNEAAKATNAIDMDGYQAGGDPSSKFTITIPVPTGGTGTTITIKFDISSAGSPTSAGANHITIATQGSGDVANAALVIKAINGTTDSRITYGNSSGDGSAGSGIIGVTASQGSNTKKVTLEIDRAGAAGNSSSAIAHGAGAVNLVDVTDFTGGTGFADADGVSNTRGFIHSASIQSFNRHQGSPTDFKILEFRKEGPKNYRAFFPHLQYDSTNSIEIRSSGIPDAIAFSGSDDHKELYPPKKFKAALYGNLGTKEGEDLYNNLFPFNMFSSSLDTKVSRELKEGLIITDQHRDTYHTYENEPLQGPFTNTHVGGNQYRHISLNKGIRENLVERNRDGRLDDDEIRPEGWIIKFDKPDAIAASAIDAIDMAGYQAAGDPSSKFNITIPSISNLLEGTGTTITIKFDISSSSSPTSAGANHITIGTSGSGDAANAALVIKAINGETDSRITYGNSSGDGSSGIGIKGVIASAGSGGTKVTLTMSVAGAVGNVSGAIAHGAGTVNLVDVTAFTNGADGVGKRLKLVSPDFDGADKPRATYLRDETAKRPVSIRNIQHTTASQDLGNFSQNYQVVMSSGRDINNHYFKENLGISVTGSQSTIVSGAIDFTLPDRTTDKFRTKSIIAERFSAPGEPATLSRGFLDLESESFSAYNSLNYRNSAVRNALRTLLTASNVHYGLSDSLEAISTSVEDKDPFRRAAFHKVNKNSAKRIELKELNPDGNPASSIATKLSAQAVDCIDTTSVGSDTKFTILVPTTAGGASSSTATVIFLDADQTTNPVEGANEIGIGINSVTDANIAALIIKAINGTADNNIDFASSGVGTSGVQGVTAVQGSTTTKITLIIDQTGTEGNLTNAITTTVAGDHDIVNLRTFSGGFIAASDDSYQTGSVSNNYYVQHQIPQSVMQYAWINASAVSGPFGFEKPNQAFGSLASDDITFVSESDFGIINQSLTNTNSANTGEANTIGFASNRSSEPAGAAIIFTDATTNGNTITITSTNGTQKTYMARTGNSFASNQFEGVTSAADAAENLKDAIAHSAGHNGEILARREGSQVILRQRDAGEDGNTVIVDALNNATAVGIDGITGNRFTGGVSNPLKDAFLPLNTLGALDDTKLTTENLVSSISNPEFTFIAQGSSENIPNNYGIATLSLHAPLTRLNGVGGYPSWKQWRAGEGPVPRYHKKNNIISVVIEKQVVSNIENIEGNLIRKKLLSFTESPLISKYKPLVHSLRFKNGEGIDVKSTYANNLKIGLNQNITINGEGDKANIKDLTGIKEKGPSPAVFEERGDQIYDELRQLYLTDTIPDQANPLETEQPAQGVNPKPVTHFVYSETVFPQQKNAHLSKIRDRSNYTQKASEISNISLGQQRTFWKNAHIDRLRPDNDSTLNSLGLKIDKDHTKGFPSTKTDNVSGGLLIVDRSNPAPTTTVTASGGSAALSMWPLDTDGEGSAVYGYTSVESEATPDFTATRYYLGRGAGELSHSDDWSLYYKDFAPTASLGYVFIQQVHFSGAYQSNDTGGSFGSVNKSPKVPTYQANALIGSNPWYDSYEDYAEDIRVMGKDYSILPEFKMTDHVDDIVDGRKQLLSLSTYQNYLEVEGAQTSATSSAPNNSFVLNEEFFDTYVVTEPMNFYKKFKQEHESSDGPSAVMQPNTLTVSFDGIMKLLPYQGFYPVNRAVQLGHLLSSSFGPILGPEDRDNWPSEVDGLRNTATRTAALIQPFFNPGILFNSIKSGLAVDWPVFKGEAAFELDDSGLRGSGFISGSTGNPTSNGSTTHGGPNFRMPFETILEPEVRLPFSGSNDEGKIIHLGPQWNQTVNFISGSDGKGTAGGINDPASVTFTFSGTPTNGKTIGIESPAGTRITGTIDTSAGASSYNPSTNVGTIGLNGASTTTLVAQRFFDFVREAIDEDNVNSLHVFQDNNVVTIFADGGVESNLLNITDGNTGTAQSQFINNVTISPIASASAGVKFTGGQNPNVSFFDCEDPAQASLTYKLAMHNFLAETTNFFLDQKDQAGTNLTTFISKPSTQFEDFVFETGVKYYMDVVLNKPKDMVIFEGPAALQLPGGRLNLTASARGSHFGPAARWTNSDGPLNDNKDDIRNFYDPAFAPWTPPYFYGESFARIVFNPKDVSNVDGIAAVTLEEILEASNVEYYNKCERHPEFAQLPEELAGLAGSNMSTTGIFKDSMNTPASASMMHLSSSVNLFGKISNKTVVQKVNPNNVLGVFAPISVTEDDESPRWVISTKFECPVLNFSGNAGPTKGTPASSLTNFEKACFDSKGMWYGSGSIPNRSVTLGIRESFPNEPDSTTKRSLIQALGFETGRKGIGKVADQKTISEAIVAIPIDSQGNRYDLDEDTFKTILANIQNGNPDVQGLNSSGLTKQDFEENGYSEIEAYLKEDIEKTSVGEMVRKMNKYVIPPHMDFRNPNLNVKPFAMYILEFEHVLDQEDLQKIWQNTMPKIALTAKKSNRTISHQVGYSWEFFPGGLPDEDIRFILFKVKKRAHNNYFASTPSQEANNNLQLSANELFGDAFSLNKESHLPYSYNWPYDFFSLVELGKMDLKVGFEPSQKSTLKADIDLVGNTAAPIGLPYPLKGYKEKQFDSSDSTGDET